MKPETRGSFELEGHYRIRCNLECCLGPGLSTPNAKRPKGKGKAPSPGSASKGSDCGTTPKQHTRGVNCIVSPARAATYDRKHREREPHPNDPFVAWTPVDDPPANDKKRPRPDHLDDE